MIENSQEFKTFEFIRKPIPSFVSLLEEFLWENKRI
jgi:hypothetical protein